MELVSLAERSRKLGSLRVPRFEVKIEGAGLPRDVLRDVTQLTYHDSVGELDSFELTVNNWDPETRRFKYVGSETAEDLEKSTREAQRFKLFEPCNKQVEVRMGYLDELQLMLTGTVTTMEPAFPRSGAPTLTVRGLNVLHELRRKRYTTVWEKKRDSDVAKNLATLRDPESGAKRLPLPIEIDSTSRDKEPELPYVAQQNQYDIDFLVTRALERGYVVFVQEASKRPKRPRRLYFGPSDGGRARQIAATTYELHWGRALVDFKPTLTTANQVRSVTVSGWNRRTREAFEKRVDLDDRELTRNRDLYRLLKRCDPREEVKVSLPVFTEKEAREKAVALLKERQKAMVQATATTVGLPDLHAGQLVSIPNVGARFSGIYFVTSTTHTIGEGGYLTQFTARREHVEGGGGG